MSGTNGNGSNWKNVALSAMWAVLLLFAGWMVADSRASRDELRAEIAQIRTQYVTDQQQASIDRQRIATMEEAIRQMTRSMDRIEAGIEDLKRRAQ